MWRTNNVYTAFNEIDEARYVVDKIQAGLNKGMHYMKLLCYIVLMRNHA